MMFKTVLVSFIDPQHELCLLAKEIDWDYMEKAFAPLYGEVGRPSILISTIVGLLPIKSRDDLGDETVMERYIDRPYCQHFCGKVYFQYKYPFDPSNLEHFRKLIGRGNEKDLQTEYRSVRKRECTQRSERGAGRYNSLGEEHHLPDRQKAYGKNDRTL